MSNVYIQFFYIRTDQGSNLQGMSCEGACKIHSEKCVGCVCVPLILGTRCAIALLHTFWNKIATKMQLFLLKTMLEHPIPF